MYKQLREGFVKRTESGVLFIASVDLHCAALLKLGNVPNHRLFRHLPGHLFSHFDIEQCLPFSDRPRLLPPDPFDDTREGDDANQGAAVGSIDNDRYLYIFPGDTEWAPR